MLANPAVAAALVTLCEAPKPFSQKSISALFRACIARAGIDWETPESLATFDALWNCDSVVAAIEALQDAHETNSDTALYERNLLAKIEAAIESETHAPAPE